MVGSPRFIFRLVSILGTIGAIVYCGWLLHHFFDVGGSWEGAKEIGLGPTIIGLGAIALIFVLVFFFKLARLFRTPGPGDSAGPRHPSPPDDDGFDADAVVARYLARHADTAERPAMAADAERRPAAPGGFGRRGSL